jgi:hypothetical protein
MKFLLEMRESGLDGRREVTATIERNNFHVRRSVKEGALPGDWMDFIAWIACELAEAMEFFSYERRDIVVELKGKDL